MMKSETSIRTKSNALRRGGDRFRTGPPAFTLVEVLISMVITVLSMAALVSGYVFATRQAEWSAYSLAAQSLAIQRLEQIRAAKWDLRGSPVIDDVISANFPTATTNILDLPVSGGNVVHATSYTQISDASSGRYPLKMIRVDCVWPFQNRLCTNTISSYRAPDQ